MPTQIPKITTIDIESLPIEGRPDYPPLPVGVSIKQWGKKSKYYAFGHIEENNCCWSEAVEAVRKAYQNKNGVLFQNAKFDLDVIETHFGIKPPKWDLVHDTMFLLFLDDPHQINLGLKESAERLLNEPPEERDRAQEWLESNKNQLGVKISKSKASEHYFGKYLCLVPGKLLGNYAKGDVNRTEALFKLLYPSIVKRNMLEAYDRERELSSILLEVEKRGLPVDLERLRRDVQFYNDWRDKLENWVIKKLNAPKDINLNSGAELMSAMIESGMVDEDRIPLTPTGKYQTNKDALFVAVTDKQLLSVLSYRSQLNTCLNTFMEPWLRTAERSNGLIYTTWNQVKAPKGGSSAGTRTGRLSSTPNFQNVPNEFKPLFSHEAKGLGLPKSPFKDLPSLPKVRSYIVPGKGRTLVDRDYSQQEPRILGHFDGGALMEKYQQDPWIDFHDYAQSELRKMGLIYERKPVKNTNLGLIYGMGLGTLAERTGLPVDETKVLKKSVLSLYPGLKEMYSDMRRRSIANEPIRTWGGREYYCEEPKVINGRMKTFDYKLVNILIQGSAADCTKEAIIRIYRAFEKLGKLGSWWILLNVHDQITCSVPVKDVHKAMEVMRREMEGIEFDVPMLSEGDISKTNWAELKTYDKKGVRV